MADEVRRIQIEVKWRAAVRAEAQRKNNAYPWVLPPSPRQNSARSESTQADSPASPEFAGTCITKRNVSCRYDATPRPSVIDLDKENIDPMPRKQSGGMTFRSEHPATDFSRYIEVSPSPDELPLQDESWERSVNFNQVVNLSCIEPASCVSGFMSQPKSYISEPSAVDMSQTLDKCWQGVSQLRADLRVLQKAAGPLE